mgnify:CR=1 FL=1
MVLLWGVLRVVDRLHIHSRLHHMLVKALVFNALVASTCLAEDAPTICFREDAAPFSFIDAQDNPAGYSVGICRKVAETFGTSTPDIRAVTVEDRFERLQSGDCDLLCEATTVTMQRRAEMEFSLITFLTGSVLLYPKDLLEVDKTADRVVSVGVLSETTSFDKLMSGELKGGAGVDFAFEVQVSHDDAEMKLLDGTLNAYIADREIVERFLETNKGLAATHKISSRPLSYEPYAIAMRMGDDTLRVKVDEVIAEMYRTDEILELLDVYLPGRSDDRLLRDLFELQSLPE